MVKGRSLRFVVQGSRENVIKELANLQIFKEEDCAGIIDCLERYEEYLPKDEKFMRRRIVNDGVGYMLPGFNYYINIKMFTLLLIMWIANWYLENEIIEFIEMLSGIEGSPVIKICEENAEKCILKEILRRKNKCGGKDILHNFKGECCNNQYQCMYNCGGKCNCGTQIVEEILKEFERKGIVKQRFGKYFYQL